MTIAQSVVSVGTATVNVIAPTHDYATFTLKNLQPATVMEYARDGHIYLIAQQFTVTQGSSLSFSILTGATGAQLDFYEIISEDSKIYAELIEGATIVTAGNAIPAYNMNRNDSDTHLAVLKGATSVTGGTTISAEFITASNQAGGALSSSKIHTLEASTEYAMRFTNQGSQTTVVFFQLGFSEQYNGLNDIWLGTVDNSFVLKAGDEIQMTLNPNETINATAKHNGCKLAVMRQE